MRHTVDSRIIGLCAVLRQAVPGHYFIDHLGIHKDFRRQGLATGLIHEVVKWLDDFKEIALDTRVFNLPAQVLYESLGFQKVPYPILKKRSTYFYYILHKNM